MLYIRKSRNHTPLFSTNKNKYVRNSKTNLLISARLCRKTLALFGEPRERDGLISTLFGPVQQEGILVGLEVILKTLGYWIVGFGNKVLCTIRQELYWQNLQSSNPVSSKSMVLPIKISGSSTKILSHFCTVPDLVNLYQRHQNDLNSRFSTKHLHPSSILKQTQHLYVSQ
jgi:hypothetical protein